MNRIVIVLLLSGLTVARLHSQTPNPSVPFVTLDAVPAGSKSEQQSHWESGWGSYDRSTQTGSSVEISVRNAGSTPASVHVITVFFDRPLYGSNMSRTVCGVDDKPVVLAPSQPAKYSVKSPEMSVRDQNYAAIGQREVQGTKVDGWVVCVLNATDNAILKIKGSSSALEAIASDRQGMARLVADYERDHGIVGAKAKAVAAGTSAVVFGPVLSVRVGDAPGLLIGCRSRGIQEPAEAVGTVFLEYDPEQLSLRVGMSIDCIAKRQGTYSYTDQGGQKKVVPVFDFVGKR